MPEDTRTDEERLASILYWQSRTPAERWAEGWRLSVEHYGMPKGNFRDGPFVQYRRNSDGSEEIINVTCGPNPLRHE